MMEMLGLPLAGSFPGASARNRHGLIADVTSLLKKD